MPEGDSIHRLAARLGPLLVGKEVRRLRARRIADRAADGVVGHRIVAVEAHGKNLLVRFDDTTLLHIHLRMDGRLFVDRPRSAFWAPRAGTPELELAVDGASIVGKKIPVCRLLTEREGAREIARLGPDLLQDFDEAEAIRRLRALASREIGDAIMLQRAIAGIGNVYKSEVLFLEGIDPRAVTGSLEADVLARIVRRAATLLRRNVGPGPRTTRPTLGGGPRVWVYARAGKPCLRCQTPIVRYYQGAAPGRSTYSCPRCQAGRPERVSRASDVRGASEASERGP
jgi:endonuclease VIII